MRPVLLVPHCGLAIGFGHHERMLALAEALRARGVEAVLSVPASHSPSIERARARDVTIAPGDSDPCHRALATAADLGASACVLDGYVFPPGFQSRLRQICPVVVVDDLGAAADCDLAVNPSVVPIPAPSGARQFLGAPDHALLSSADRSARTERLDHTPESDRVIVSAGATDASGLALHIASRIINAGAPIHVILVAGPETLLTDVPYGIEVIRQPRSLSALLCSSSVYVGAAGVTSVQAACIGVPMVVVPTVENQRSQARALADASCAVMVTDGDEAARVALTLLADTPRRHAMSQAGRALVDGRGSDRVAGAILALAAAQSAVEPMPRQ
jgi:spore coat polysaccharide biosynthesis predicted glycosyltransferase SpsG